MKDSRKAVLYAMLIAALAYAPESAPVGQYAGLARYWVTFATVLLAAYSVLSTLSAIAWHFVAYRLRNGGFPPVWAQAGVPEDDEETLDSTGFMAAPLGIALYQGFYMFAGCAAAWLVSRVWLFLAHKWAYEAFKRR